MVTISTPLLDVNQIFPVERQIDAFLAAAPVKPAGRRLHDLQIDAWVAKERLAAERRAEDTSALRAVEFLARWAFDALASHGLVKCDISHREGKITVSVGADMVKVKRSGIDNRAGGGVRGVVCGFSTGSRRRMLEATASVHDLDTRPGLFVTLTYPDVFASDSDVWHRDLDVFLKRLVRKFPGVGGLWRLEMMVRKSGLVNEGVFAPHFHILVFMDEKFIGKRLNWLRVWVSLAWAAVVGSDDLNHVKAGTNVRVIYNRAHAMRYCSKYSAKNADEGFAVGRRWGTFGVLDRSEMWSAVISRQAFYTFKRYAVRLLESRGRKFASRLRRSSPLGGFTVFGMGGQSVPGCSDVLNSTCFALLLDAIYQARGSPRELMF